MINDLQVSLGSALSKLSDYFRNDSETLHEAVALVFSSIFRSYGMQCIIVGGQSAAYWMRMPGSTDVDFVAKNSYQISTILEDCGFNKTDFKFRYVHPATNIMIELVDEAVSINGVRKISTVEIDKNEIEDQTVRSLMCGSAEILDPVCVFLNYAEASNNDSIWFDYEDQGALAIERAQALIILYGSVIIPALSLLMRNGNLDKKIVNILSERFNIKLLS